MKKLKHYLLMSLELLLVIAITIVMMVGCIGAYSLITL